MIRYTDQSISKYPPLLALVQRLLLLSMLSVDIFCVFPTNPHIAHNSIRRSRMNFRTSFSALSEWKIFKICSPFKEFLVNVVVLVEEFYYVWNLKSTP